MTVKCQWPRGPLINYLALSDWITWKKTSAIPRVSNIAQQITIRNTSFSSQLMNRPNKLKCMSLAGFSTLVYCLQVMSEPSPKWSAFQVVHPRVGLLALQTLNYAGNKEKIGLLAPFVSYKENKALWILHQFSVLSQNIFFLTNSYFSPRGQRCQVLP